MASTQPRQCRAVAPNNPEGYPSPVLGQNYEGQNYEGQNYEGQNYEGQNYEGQNYEGLGFPLHSVTSLRGCVRQTIIHGSRRVIAMVGAEL